MSIVKRSILSTILVALVAIMCFGLAGCGADEDEGYITISDVSTFAVSQDTTLEAALNGVTVTFDDPNDSLEPVSATGYVEMVQKGFNIVCSGFSASEIEDNGNAVKFNFAYGIYSKLVIVSVS